MQDLIVAVPTWNVRPYIAQCLASVASQTDPVSLRRVVVCDDHSTDGTWELLEELKKTFEFDLIRSDRPQRGPYWIFNRVFERYPARLYLTLGSDDILMPEAVTLIREVMEQTGAWMAGGQYRRLHQDGTPFGDEDFTWKPFDVNRFMELGRQHPIIQSGMLMDRRTLDSIGPYNEGYRCGMDTEFFYRAAAAGVPMRNSPQVTVLVRVSRPGSLTTDPASGMQSPYRQQVREMLEKQYPSFWRFSPQCVDFLKREAEIAGTNPCLTVFTLDYLARYRDTVRSRGGGEAAARAQVQWLEGQMRRLAASVRAGAQPSQPQPALRF